MVDDDDDDDDADDDYDDDDDDDDNVDYQSAFHFFKVDNRGSKEVQIFGSSTPTA